MKKLESKSIKEWIENGKKSNKDYVFYDGYCLDLSNFKYLHPGGSQIVQSYLYKDVTSILFTVFPHNKVTTPKILERYRVGILAEVP